MVEEILNIKKVNHFQLENVTSNEVGEEIFACRGLSGTSSRGNCLPVEPRKDSSVN